MMHNEHQGPKQGCKFLLDTLLNYLGVRMVTVHTINGLISA